MNETVLNFDEVKQEFYINQPVFDKFNFREMALEELFNKDYSYLIIKNFIDKDIAIKVRDFYSKTKNKESFLQVNENGNHRIFFYQNSPYKYPKFITSLLNHCMVIKNRLFEFHDFYQIYCMDKRVNPKDYNEVSRLQSLHSWSSIYWYKNGNSHFRHIDNYGELACFVVFTKKGKDYDSGGLQVEKVDGETTVLMDDYYDYGDLCFLDQSQVYHEVLPIKTSGNQIGRMQLYIPTIPPNYMRKGLIYECYPYKVFFTDENIGFSKKIHFWINNVIGEKNVHYSRKIYKHYENEIGV